MLLIKLFVDITNANFHQNNNDYNRNNSNINGNNNSNKNNIKSVQPVVLGRHLDI